MMFDKHRNTETQHQSRCAVPHQCSNVCTCNLPFISFLKLMPSSRDKEKSAATSVEETKESVARKPSQDNDDASITYLSESITSESSSAGREGHRRRKHRKKQSKRRKKKAQHYSSSESGSSDSDRRRRSRRRHKHRKKEKRHHNHKKKKRKRSEEMASDDDNVRRDVISGKKIKMHIDKSQDDLVEEERRKNLLRFMNSSL
jgi:hypothetical protein